MPHYTISIIRDRGIDRNAMDYILARHRPGSIQFVDGWTGKGAIQRQLNAAMEDYPGVDPSLAVLSDPACVAGKYGTRDDFLIASSCLNSTISGLLSRTFLRTDIIGAEDFHGAVFYRELQDQDLTNSFIGAIERRFRVPAADCGEQTEPWGAGLEEVREIGRAFGVDDIHLIKPSIGTIAGSARGRLEKSWSHRQTSAPGIFQLAQKRAFPSRVPADRTGLRYRDMAGTRE